MINTIYQKLILPTLFLFTLVSVINWKILPCVCFMVVVRKKVQDIVKTYTNGAVSLVTCNMRQHAAVRQTEMISQYAPGQQANYHLQSRAILVPLHWNRSGTQRVRWAQLGVNDRYTDTWYVSHKAHIQQGSQPVRLAA